MPVTSGFNHVATITPDGNTIYFARFAGSGDKRVIGTTTDIFVTHRVKQSGEWPGTGADWTPPERLPDTVNGDSIDQEPRITPDASRLGMLASICEPRRNDGTPEKLGTEIAMSR